MSLIAQLKGENEPKQGRAGKAKAKAVAKNNVIDEDDGISIDRYANIDYIRNGIIR